MQTGKNNGNQYNQKFNERKMEEKVMSREYLKFLEIMEQSVALRDGKYYFKLPCRNGEVYLPNNLAVAKKISWVCRVQK